MDPKQSLIKELLCIGKSYDCVTKMLKVWCSSFQSLVSKAKLWIYTTAPAEPDTGAKN